MHQVLDGVACGVSSENGLLDVICDICHSVATNAFLCTKCDMTFHPNCILITNDLPNRNCNHQIIDPSDSIDLLLEQVKHLTLLIQSQENNLRVVKNLLNDRVSEEHVINLKK